ncbi:amidase [Actinomadura mexicana]|uniref:Aspartyl-tRNA(Asn)/glutamyl-tRNA(Gln) amidotransferase subunit A n=1 Tax=Actinomadura mexicana TaxID=134959 RepID=A0A238WSY5_9ACTN|nr:amidase [Actinomadura mexicana]SNR49491.1 aspartyl-tRNA(Asn)/glutamyl-tRNA(Gln) amidotransferase subunit A [Actinomadura mexicana]
MGGFFTGRTLTGIGRDLRAGRESARGLVARVLESVDEDLNAFVTLDAEGAEAAARWADEELASGIDRGPLHGVPVAVKDIVDVAGLPTGMGSGHFAGHVAEADAVCVTMLRDAGAVIVGKTGTQEFAFGGSGDVSVNGAVRNPRDRERMSGGSSSGSAVAVAAGMVPLAIGTDTGGSVRIPSAFCGIAGFKPPHGAIPTGGVFPLSRSLDHVGVLAATADDCRVAYHALTGPAEAVPSLLDGSPGGDRAGAAPYGRVAWIEPPVCDPEVERRVRALFPDAPSERIDFAGLRQVFLAIEYSEAYDVHAERVAEAPGRYQPATLARLRDAGRMPGWRLVRALRERDRYAEEIAGLLDRYDLLAMPTMPIPAPRIGAVEVGLGPLTALLVGLTSPWNVLGLPALSVPAGTVPADGGGELPIGAQLVTRRGAESLLFTAAEHLAP